MKNYKILLLSALSAVTLILGACDDDDITVVENVPGINVATPQIIEATSNYATVSATFGLNPGARYTNAGFCYALSEMPTIYDSTVDGTVKDNTVTATITGLAPNKLYYVRAFVCEYAGDVVYSSQFTVNTGDGALTEALAAYEAPSYPDHYVDIAAWDKHSAWNLANVHDPTVMKADDGYFYMYQTDASYGNAHDGHGHFHGRRSKDLVNWEYLGSTMDEAPAWVSQKCNELRAAEGLAALNFTTSSYGYWAPVARNLGNGTYRMYYSIVVNHPIVEGEQGGRSAWAERGFIGMMETKDPASNKWEDKGYVICSSTDRGFNWFCANDWANAYYRFNAIDPSYIITPEGAHWLIYGSWHSGIAAIEVDATSGMPVNTLGNPWGDKADDIAAYGTRIYTRAANNRWQASEGPEIIYRNGYYYLFLAYDGLDVPYNTRVVRSTSVTGPYLGIDGTDVTTLGGDAYPVVTHPYKFADNPGWVGISHCAVFSDGNDNWFYASQGRLPAGAYGNDFANAVMLGHVRSILWTADGWPVVLPERYGAVPQASIAEDELVGNWEHINLAYKYGEQKASEKLVLGSDHTVTDGPWKGSEWKYDVTTGTLTIGSASLRVARECDWEASPRTHTIVYAGIESTNTYWGKKVK